MLKRTNPEDDAEGFQHLRESYELARQLASYADIDETISLTTDFPAESVAAAPPPQAARVDDPAGIELDAALANLGRELRTETPVPDERLHELLRAVLGCDL